MTTRTKATNPQEASISDKTAKAPIINDKDLLTLLAQRFRNEQDFRNRIYEKGGGFTGQIGLKSKGPQEIMPDGTFKPVTENELENLFHERRSWHYPGTGRVMAAAVLDGRGLVVFAAENKSADGRVKIPRRINVLDKIYLAAELKLKITEDLSMDFLDRASRFPLSVMLEKLRRS